MVGMRVVVKSIAGAVRAECACRVAGASSSRLLSYSVASVTRFGSASSHASGLTRDFNTHSAKRQAAATTPNADAAAAPEGPNASDKAERTLKRFWKTVSVQSNTRPDLPSHYTINLDSRALRTPSGNVLRIAHGRGLLAGLIAQEWHEQKTVLKPHALPLTSLVARSIDGLGTEAARKEVCEGLMNYLDTDTILFHEDAPRQLVRLQEERWQPLLKWASEHIQQPIEIYKTLFNTAQPAQTRATILERILKLDPLSLAAFERAVLSCKSVLIALGLLEGRLSVEDASRAAEVEVASQIERWGEVEDTHDVDFHDLRRQLGSVSIVLMSPSSS
ncbi:ATP synthase mitochondrial F1 complex assembly factor 2 [Tilletia horrida]|uniref:ATP synthase mitochondrial F1 complex assembly factor 2 n=1 Tax=Tilletia horrida TaxID=155126 RepID=A0AAN6GNP7_9BASI|nr:ATP synthase mitochondrial F1 complex assembly factor 2 [Tilletia horrida]KAK0562535.1 ATP synthase mitochondrial F1 complex assembly factor 2 [Tilletia horrida]